MFIFLFCLAVRSYPTPEGNPLKMARDFQLTVLREGGQVGELESVEFLTWFASFMVYDMSAFSLK